MLYRVDSMFAYCVMVVGQVRWWNVGRISQEECATPITITPAICAARAKGRQLLPVNHDLSQRALTISRTVYARYTLLRLFLTGLTNF